jgi:kinesin family member 11
MSSLDDFVGISVQTVEDMRLVGHEFQDRQLQALSSHSTHIEGQLQQIQKALQTIHAKDDVSTKALVAVQKAVKDMQDGLEQSVSTWEVELEQKCVDICQKLMVSSNEGFVAVRPKYRSLSLSMLT